MTTLTIGKIRGLQQCATLEHALVILALDHRNNLKNALRPEAPETVTPDEMVEFKLEVASVLAASSSAVLLDPEVGAAQAVARGVLPPFVGLVVALDATGYTGNPNARQSQVLPGWSVAKARRMGANAVKLLVYFHPDSPLADEIVKLVIDTAWECQVHDIPFFLEPLSYSLDPQKKGLSGDERRQVVLQTARRLSNLGVDVLKVEFPIDIHTHPDENEWADACAELTQVSLVPWVLLSASAPYEVYLRQVEVALKNGASGVAVGRAVWQEVPGLQPRYRRNYLINTALGRMEKIFELCNQFGRPWDAEYTRPKITPEWYREY